ncbi:hypothetical protein Tco_1478924 [Tanacetum coccineum]
MRNKIFMHSIQHDSVLGTLNTYLAFTTGAATPKKARKFKKSTSPSKKKALSTGVQIQDTLGVPVLKKKAPAKVERSKGINLLSDGADFESEVPDEPKGKTINTSERISLKPRVPNVSKVDSSESKNTSWGDSDDDNDDDDDQQSNDERTESNDDEKAADINKTDDEEDDEFVHTPDEYVPNDDEDVDDEEYDRINKEMYDDANVKLKDVEPEVIPKISSALTTTIPPPIPSFIPLQQQSTPIPTATTTEATTSTTAFPNSTTLSTIYQKLSDLESDVKTLKNVDHSSALRVTIKFDVPTIVQEFLGTTMDDALYKVL